MPGAEPFSADGGPIGVLVLHGFSGSPVSMRPWTEHLARAGFTVLLPRLPGHGTRWQDLNLTRWQDWYAEAERGFLDLRERCETVFVMGLSVGGTLALRLAEEYGDEVTGVAVVNVSLMTSDPRAKLSGLIRLVTPAFPGITDDIKKPGVTEGGYDKLPTRAFHSLRALWALTRADLGKVTQPLLVMHSPDDHVMEPKNTEVLLAEVGSHDVTDVVLPDSYHVATLDNDAPTIFAESVSFIHRVIGASQPDEPQAAGAP